MLKEKMIKAVQPKLGNQSLYQLSQMKAFVDASLKEVVSQNFDNDADKIKYLLEVLYNIRDFVLSQTTENSVRLGLIEQFKKLEEEIELGNDIQKQEENT